MSDQSQLLSKLTSYLDEHSIGTSFLPLSRPEPSLSAADKEFLVDLLMLQPTHYDIGLEMARANAFFVLGDHQNSEHIYEKILSKDPYHISARYNLGMTHIKSDKLHKAITELNKAIQQNTRFAEGYYQRGNAYDETGNSLNAMEDYTQAISINPNFVQAL